MNSLRIRVSKLKPMHGVTDEFIWAIQVSCDGLNWWTLERKKDFDSCLTLAKDLLVFVTKNQIVKEEAVLWTKQV